MENVYADLDAIYQADLSSPSRLVDFNLEGFDNIENWLADPTNNTNVSMLENVIFEIQEGELHEYDDSVSTYYNSSSVSSLHSSQYSTDSTRIREGNLIDMGEQPIPRPRRIRRVGIETLILRIFYTKRGNTPKKEYIRLRLIRGQKKGFRQALNNKLPTEHALHAFDPDNHQSMNLWKLFKNCVKENIAELKEIAKTESGPKTDGKAKKRVVMSDEAKSYNNKFCKQYFSKKSVLQSYFWYIELVFTSSDPATLCHKFDIRCCQSENHSGECVRKWDILHTFTYNIMLRSIDIRPFFPCNFSPKEISEEELRMFDQIKNRDEIIIIEDGFQSVNHEVVALESYI